MCGLGNNGGSSTLVRSANTLVELGHDVTLIDSFRNKHTWTPLKAKHIRIKSLKEAPDADVVIATGYKTVKFTVRLPDRCGKKVHWIRGWETWTMSEPIINTRILQAPTFKIVNGLCLQKKLEKYDTPSVIIRPGYDFDEIIPTRIRENRKKKVLIVGGLNNHRHKSKRSNWVVELGANLKRRHPRLRLWMFGMERCPPGIVVDKYYKNPSLPEKNTFYNSCDIWLAPTQNEGLHICPAEAMMTECVVVGSNAEMSGLKDYLIHEETGLVAKAGNTPQFIDRIQKLINDTDLRRKLGKAGREKILSLGNRHDNMKKLVEILEGVG